MKLDSIKFAGLFGAIFLLVGVGLLIGIYAGLSHAWVDSHHLLMTVLIGGIFSIIGLILLFLAIWKSKRKKWLLHHGTRVMAKVTEIFLDSTIHINGKNPWRITCQWQSPRSGKIFIFMSDYLWQKPDEHLMGQELEILIDQNNPKIYFIDLTRQLTKVA